MASRGSSQPEDFVGRQTQLADLKDLWKRRTKAALVTCLGRRRIGKSRLIQEFARRNAQHFFEFQGLTPRDEQTDKHQLRHFGEKLAEYMKLDEPVAVSSWTQAFAFLERLIPRQGRTVVLLDEISWMGRHDKDFAGRLKDAWDTRFQHLGGLILVLCGSVSSWIEKNLIQHTGFLDRLALRLKLPELPLHDANQLVWRGEKQVSAMEKLSMLAVTGGVPRYLEQIDPKASAEENIRRLCFQSEGALFRPDGRIDEFDAIFTDIFDRRAETYRQMVEQLADGSKTISELCKALGKTRAGYIANYLRDLELAGFVREEPHFTVGRGAGKISHFRLSDNLLRFHLKYIMPRRHDIAQGRFHFSGLDSLLAWDTIQGLQFENLILNNDQFVQRRLGIEGKVLRGGPYRQSATKRRDGCQIDLLLETKRSLYIVEIKFRGQIGREVINEVEEKIDRLYVPRDRKGLNRFPVLIYAGELVDSVREEDFFQTIIDFSELLDGG